MSGAKLFTLVVVFFITSMVSVVTGSTSLITVPVMIALGIEAYIAVATNMMALTFMSVGGSLPFMGRGVLGRSRLLPLIVLTIIGSGLGALLSGRGRTFFLTSLFIELIDLVVKALFRAPIHQVTSGHSWYKLCFDSHGCSGLAEFCFVCLRTNRQD